MRARMDVIAAHVCAQIGLPLRASLLARLFDRGMSVSHEGFSMSMRASSADRLIAALELLFDAAAEVCRERVLRKDVPPEDAAPVLLFDEVQDLIKDARLARVGGRDVFEALATLAVKYGVDAQSVRVAVAGSSALLALEFDKTVASGARWSPHLMRDPERGAVQALLLRNGYSTADADAILDLCGTRLRLLDAPLKQGAARVSARDVCLLARWTAERQFATWFACLTPQDTAACAAVLDAVAQHAAPQPNAPRTACPTLYALPAACQAADLAQILYVCPDLTLSFQSLLHAHTWQHVRHRYGVPTARVTAAAAAPVS